LSRGCDNAQSQIAAQDPNCPPQALAGVLARGKDDLVSRIAFKNSKCPLKAKIKWMQDTGKIGKEDPTKHIIDYEGKQEQDLQKLRDMID